MYKPRRWTSNIHELNNIRIWHIGQTYCCIIWFTWTCVWFSLAILSHYAFLILFRYADLSGGDNSDDAATVTGVATLMEMSVTISVTPTFVVKSSVKLIKQETEFMVSEQWKCCTWKMQYCVIINSEITLFFEHLGVFSKKVFVWEFQWFLLVSTVFLYLS